MISYIAPHWNIPEATNLLHRYFRSLDHNHDLVCFIYFNYLYYFY